MDTRTFTVAAARVDDPDIAPMPSYRLILPDGSEELLSDEIHGFEFEPGVEQQIEVAVRRVPDPPPGASALRYDLVRVIAAPPPCFPGFVDRKRIAAARCL